MIASAVSGAAERPNVILIISDDQGFPDYGFMGHKTVRTPNLDRLAAQSLLYTRGYVMPVCSPSLASLLTGKLPHAHGITGNDLAKSSAPGLDGKKRDPLTRRLLNNSLVLPKALTEAGYLTFQSGKLWNATYRDVGFTHGMTDTAGRHGDAGLAIGRNRMQPIFDFVATAQAAKKPFFVWYAPLLPHQPHNPPAALLVKYEGRGLSPVAQKYHAMVEWFDQTCGDLDDFLVRNKLAENTVILYLADNGWDGVNAQNGNRAKLSPYELGVRTPMFVHWPGKVAPRRDDETLASIIDFAPTILKLCGARAPADLPGLDLLDRSAMNSRRTVFVESYTHDIADLDNPSQSLVAQVVINGWTKLLLPGPAIPDRKFASGPKTAELFDLRSDPFETNNIAANRSAEVERLRTIQRGAWDPAKDSPTAKPQKR